MGEPEWLDFPIMTMTEYEPAETVISYVIKDNPRQYYSLCNKGLLRYHMLWKIPNERCLRYKVFPKIHKKCNLREKLFFISIKYKRIRKYAIDNTS